MKKKTTICLALLILLIGLTGCNKSENNPSEDIYDHQDETTAPTATPTSEEASSEEPASEEPTSEEPSNEEPAADQFADLDYEDQFKAPVDGEIIAVMMTSMGVIKLRLFEEAAPKAVENFVTHSENGYYDGLTFHRVMNDFMIQGGDPLGTGTGGESIYGGSFEDEFVMNYLSYKGALCMANSGAGTNGSQFFIVQTNQVNAELVDSLANAGFPEQVITNYQTYGVTPWLFFKHTTFGQVFEGIEIVDQIAAVEVDGDSKPIEDVIIEKIEIIEYNQ